MNEDGHTSDSSLPTTPSAADLYRIAQSKKESILRRLKKDTEGTIVLVGALESLTKPAVALVRLAEGIIMPNSIEVPLPVRFVFIVLTPKPSPNMDFHEVGRSFSTLMSNPVREFINRLTEYKYCFCIHQFFSFLFHIKANLVRTVPILKILFLFVHTVNPLITISLLHCKI